jgi:hypothetical protein
LREYGEERDARRIARAIATARERQPIETTSELAAADLAGQGRAAGNGPAAAGPVDPATRAFQALRIEVNQELVGLKQLMDQAIGRLAQGGRLVVISYHSLEDRIVKTTMRDLERGAVDVDLRTAPRRDPPDRSSHQEALRPTEEEVDAQSPGPFGAAARGAEVVEDLGARLKSIYAVHRPVHNAYLVRQRDRRRARELLLGLAGVLPLGIAFIAYTGFISRCCAPAIASTSWIAACTACRRRSAGCAWKSSYLASPARIEERARQELGMQAPTVEQLIFAAEIPGGTR